MKRTRILSAALALLALAACSSPPPPEEDKVTVGRVQGEIKVGMDAASVAQILGSPNIVTTDEQRREVWIYDKISSDRVDTSSSIGGGIIIFGGGKSSSSSSSNQRTLTIIIKYDEEKKVRDFAYNYSSF
jgi:outer membrane protein assembly factor BamE (lipoprotein component of BamABCDE complex)